MFENGLETKCYNEFFLSKHASTKEALGIHGLTKMKLKEKKAILQGEQRYKNFTDFINLRKGLPIVSFNVKYDRDKVLIPAFKRIKSGLMKKSVHRWRCAQEICKRTGNWRLWNLDEALEHFGFKRRPDDAFHDAIQDARLAAKVYMMAVKLTPLKEEKHGFIEENGEDRGV